MASKQPPSSSSESSSLPDEPSLDSNCDNPTRWERGLSGSDSDVDDSTDQADPANWDRQQKRVFHRSSSLLNYWESHDYQIVWVTLTSCPESDDADALSYNLQRLRQTIERAELARDEDGEYHSLAHIDQLEQLCIRTSEGPEGKGVLHLFWAWKPHSGAHSRSLYIPRWWLSMQWGRIHGPHDEHSEEAVQPLWTWIERVGQAEYHSVENLARYCVSQYLGEHGEALEHCSWSHERTLGGSLTEAWETVRGHFESVEEAVTHWEDLMAGETLELSAGTEGIDYAITVEPPPELDIERGTISITPPEDYHSPGPDGETRSRSLREIRGLTHVRPGKPLDGQTGVSWFRDRA